MGILKDAIKIGHFGLSQGRRNVIGGWFGEFHRYYGIQLKHPNISRPVLATHSVVGKIPYHQSVRSGIAIPPVGSSINVLNGIGKVVGRRRLLQGSRVQLIDEHGRRKDFGERTVRLLDQLKGRLIKELKGEFLGIIVRGNFDANGRTGNGPRSGT